VELLTLVALVSEPSLLGRAQQVVAEVARAHPARTVVAVWKPGTPPAITADVTLHRVAPGGPACGDAIALEAIGDGREWLPESTERLALPDLPICLWWVGDLPDRDDLFDRMAVGADTVVVNSEEMDLRDLEKLSSIVSRSLDRYALSDLGWIRLRSVRELVARFFDDQAARSCLTGLQRMCIEFVAPANEVDVASTQAGMLFGWFVSVLALGGQPPHWTRGEGWAEAVLGGVVGRFERQPRQDVPKGSIVRMTIECVGARFEICRQVDPQVFRWLREVPSAPVPAQMMRVGLHEEAALLVRCLEDPRRDRILETSLHTATQIVRPMAPRLSVAPRRPEPP
jgi:hypothetical protein